MKTIYKSILIISALLFVLEFASLAIIVKIPKEFFPINRILLIFTIVILLMNLISMVIAIIKLKGLDSKKKG